MTRRQWFWIVLGVVAAHAGLFWLVAGTNSLPKVTPIPRPTFVAKEAKWTDEVTGDPMVYREFTVSTRLALPDVLMERKEER
ncbi:MAG TPA: hypothetical protein VNQ90_11270 [Chthoniobacteraceae bacterium]|nr:hypothetical protein [Chthoniobacteraceae bacterium]